MLGSYPCGGIICSYFTDFSSPTVTVAVAVAAIVTATATARQARGDRDITKCVV